MNNEDSTTTRVCPYRLLIRAKLFSRSRAEEFMPCYGKRCPYYEKWDANEYCSKVDKER